MLNQEYNGFWRFDSNKIILEPWENENTQDGIGRNAFAYICWPNESWLKDTLMTCVKMQDDGFIQLYRYPGKGAETMSRDHVGAIILALYLNRDAEELKIILDNLPWRLSRQYTQTIDFWLWQKSLKLEKWRYAIAQVFFILNILMFLFVIPWNFLMRSILGVYKIPIKQMNMPEDFVEFTGWKKWTDKSIYPHFSLFLLAWQIKSLPNSFLKWLLQRLLRVESRNIVIDAVLGKKLTKEDYNTFQPTTSFIWASPMDSTVRAYFAPLSEEGSRYNDLNRGMLDYLWFGIDRIIEKSKDETIDQIKNKRPIIHY